MESKSKKIRPLIVKDFVLSGEEAKEFIKKIDEATKNRGTIDFTEQSKVCKEILKN